jgi:hypothetical protein
MRDQRTAAMIGRGNSSRWRNDRWDVQWLIGAACLRCPARLLELARMGLCCGVDNETDLSKVPCLTVRPDDRDGVAERAWVRSLRLRPSSRSHSRTAIRRHTPRDWQFGADAGGMGQRRECLEWLAVGGGGGVVDMLTRRE